VDFRWTQGGLFNHLAEKEHSKMSETAKKEQQNEEQPTLDDFEEQEEIASRKKLEALKEDLSKRWTGLSTDAVKVHIVRKYPYWCEGHLMTLYGGGQYQLQFVNSQGQFVMQRTVHIAGDPCEQGERLETPDEKKKRLREEERLDKLNQMLMLGNQQKQENNGNMLEVFKQMQEAQQRQIDLVIQLTHNQPQQNQPNLRETIGIVKELQEGLKEGGDTEHLLSLVEKFMTESSKEVKKQETAPRMLGMNYTGLAPAPAPAQVAPAPQGSNVQAAFQELTNMEPSEAMGVLEEAFENAPPENQKKWMQIFGGDDNIGSPDQEDEESDQDSNGVEDDDPRGSDSP